MGNWTSSPSGGAVVTSLQRNGCRIAYYIVTTPEATPVLSLDGSSFTVEAFNPTSLTAAVQSCDRNDADAATAGVALNANNILTGLDGSTTVALSPADSDAFSHIRVNITAGTGGTIKVTLRP